MRFVIFGSIFFLVMAAGNVYIYRSFFTIFTPAFFMFAAAIPLFFMRGGVVFFVVAVGARRGFFVFFFSAPDQECL